jgi:cell division protease FtsH
LTTVLQVTNMARQMVINYGMSDIGPWSLLDPSAQSGDVVMRMMARNSMSENLQQRIDDAVKKIAEEAYEVALRHIRDNRWVLQLSVLMQQSAAVRRTFYI